MQIVHLPRRFVRQEWGGTETVVLETAKQQIAAGHHASILCPSMLSTAGADAMDGVPILRVPYFYPYLGLSADARLQLDKKGGNIFSFSLLRALAQLPQLDIIHLHTGKRVGGIARMAARKRRIPYIISLHGGVFDVPDEEAASWTAPSTGAWEWGKMLGWWVGSRRVMDDAAAIVCVGAQEREEVAARYPRQRVVYLPNGVNTTRFATGDGQAFRLKHGIAREATVILCVGRLDQQKNQQLLLQVFPELRARMPEAHLVCMGAVTNEAYYQRLIAMRDSSAHAAAITLLTGVPHDSPDLVDAYHAADVFVLPSIHEPFGIVILEAWSAGTPVIASRVGGVQTLVTDGEDGLLFDPHDSAALLERLLAVLQHPERRAALRERALANVHAQYSWEAVTQRLLTLYEDVRREYSIHQ